MKSSRFFKLALLLALLTFLSGCAMMHRRTHPKEVLLRFKLVPGESLQYKTVLHGHGKSRLIRPTEPPLKREIDFTQTLYFTQTTIKSENEFSRQELRYDDIDISVTIDGQSKPNITQNLKTAKPLLVNRPIQFLRSDRGEIKEVEGFSKVAREFMQKKPIGQEQDVVVSTGILRSLGQFIQRAVSQNIRSFPDTPVKIGYGWKDEVTQEMPFMGKLKSTYSAKLVGFVKINDKMHAKIHYTHTMENLPDNTAQQFGGMKYRQKIKGEGYHYFSLEGSTTAYLVKTTANFTSDLEINREMISPSGDKQPVKNIVRMKLDSTMELL